jgi:hypothetical protein
MVEPLNFKFEEAWRPYGTIHNTDELDFSFVEPSK